MLEKIRVYFKNKEEKTKRQRMRSWYHSKFSSMNQTPASGLIKLLRRQEKELEGVRLHLLRVQDEGKKMTLQEHEYLASNLINQISYKLKKDYRRI